MVTSVTIVVALLVLLVILLVSGIVASEVAAMIICGCFAALGYLKEDEIFSGFSSNAVVTTVCSFFLSGALRQTGVADRVGRLVLRIAGDSDKAITAVLMLSCAFFSAFMNNVAAVALMFPSALYVAHERGLSPGRLLMPLSFSAVLGGMLTVLGTPPNLLASEILQSQGHAPFAFFEFTFFGALAVVVGISLFAFGSDLFLPKGEQRTSAGHKKRPLPELYNLYESLFTLKIPEISGLIGQTLASAQFGGTLGVRVLGIISDSGRKTLSPSADQVLAAGDTLIVGGSKDEINALSRFNGVNVGVLPKSTMPHDLASIVTAPIAIDEKLIFGKTVREIRFSERYGVMVIAIERNNTILYHELGGHEIQKSDILHVIGPEGALRILLERPEIKLMGSVLSVADAENRSLCEINLPAESALVGLSIRQSRMGELFGLTALGLIRNSQFQFALDGNAALNAGDSIIVVGDSERLIRMQQFAGLIFGEDLAHEDLKNNTLGLFEAVLMPRSRLIGRTIAEVQFRRRFDLDVMAIWRSGAPIQAHIGRIPLRFGDALLLRGARSRATFLQSEGELVVTSEVLNTQYRTNRAIFAVLAAAVLILLPLFNLVPVSLAALLAALVVVLSGAYLVDEAYRDIEWRIIFYVGALIPSGIVLQRVGAISLLSQYLANFSGQISHYATCAVLCIVTSAISQVLDAILGVTLVLPLAIGIGQTLGMDVRALAMSITLASSTAFMAPWSHKGHLLVMGAGGYKNRDYFFVGTVLTVILLAIEVFIVPWMMY